jgi:hypothetical protein
MRHSYTIENGCYKDLRSRFGSGLEDGYITHFVAQLPPTAKPAQEPVTRTSKTPAVIDHDHLFIGPGPWGPAHRDSWAKLDRILSIDPTTMRRESAALDRPRFDALLAAIRHHG